MNEVLEMLATVVTEGVVYWSGSYIRIFRLTVWNDRLMLGRYDLNLHTQHLFPFPYDTTIPSNVEQCHITYDHTSVSLRTRTKKSPVDEPTTALDILKTKPISFTTTDHHEKTHPSMLI